MFLHSVSALSNFPYEKVQIKLNPSLAGQQNIACGFYFADAYWGAEKNNHKFGDIKINQAGADPFILQSTTLSSQFDLTYTNQYVQGINYLDIPTDFPVFFETSAIKHHEFLAVFFDSGNANNTPSIAIYPSTPFPKLTKLSSQSFSISGMMFPLSAGFLSASIFGEDSYNNVKRTVNPTLLPSLTLFDSKIVIPSESYIGPSGSVELINDFYFSKHKRFNTWSTVSEAKYGQIFLNTALPDINIIPESFLLTFPLSSTNVVGAPFYNLAFSHIENNNYYLSALSPIVGTTPIISAILFPQTGKITIGLSPTYHLPVIADSVTRLVVSYETSAYSFTKSTNPAVFRQTAAITASANNFYTVSTEISPYLLNYKVSVSSLNVPLEDAFTIMFSPSSMLVPSQTVTSAIILSTVMVDNFNQIYFPITQNDVCIQYTDVDAGDVFTDISPLYARDLASNIVYSKNQWIPGSAALYLFNDDNVPEVYSLVITVSATNNSIWGYQMPDFLLNKDLINLDLIITEYTNNSATVLAADMGVYNISETVRWDVSPSNNIIIYDTISAITLGVPTPANDLMVFIEQLGVGDTTITLHLDEFGISKSVVWSPTSSVFAETYLTLSGSINDFSPIKTASVSALINKGGLEYPIPTDSLIIWEETLNDPTGTTTFYDYNNTLIFENVVYQALNNNSAIKPTFTTSLVVQNPQTLAFNINVSIFSNLFSKSNNLLLVAREYPANLNFFGNLTASTGLQFSTETKHAQSFTTTPTITAFADVDALDNVPNANIRWTLPDGSAVVGISALFNLTTSGVLSFSALSARPRFGGFGFYNFVDYIDLFVLSGLAEFGYIAFPQKKYFPEQTLLIDDGSYLNSVGLTALKNCGSQVITISAFGGFDRYYYSIGTKTVSSTSNIIDINVSFSDVSSSGLIQLSAFDERFPESNTLTVYNYASSTNVNVFRQDLTFAATPTVSTILTTDRTVFNTDILNTTFFDTDISFSPNNIPVTDGTFLYVLSSTRSIKYSSLNNISENSNSFQFTNLVSDFFSISANTYNIFNFYLSGNIAKQPNNDCAIWQPLISNVITITAYDGINPNLQIFTENHLNSTNETVYFVNKTDRVLPFAPSSFIFDDGNGHIQTVSSVLSTLTGFYTTEGTYNTALTAVVEGVAITKTWPAFIIIKDTFTAYSSAINRQFHESLTLPFTFACINPNDWQFATTINAAFDEIKNNFDYLRTASTTIDINNPKYYIGYWGFYENGSRSWSYDLPVLPLIPSDFRDAIVIDNKFFILHSDSISIHENNFELTTISVITNITEGEKFISPSRLIYNSENNKLIVLDQTQKLIYVFALANNLLTIQYYWGGIGSKNGRTSLNNPCDITFDDDYNLYVVDQDSLNIKIYNASLNWRSNLTDEEWTVDNAPLSVANNGSKTFVLTNANVVYIFENAQRIDKFVVVKNGKRIYCDSNSPGLLYVLADQIYVYGENKIFVNTVSLPFTDFEALLFDDNETYALSNSVLCKFINYIEYISILDDDSSCPYWSWNSIFVQPNEPVTDFVLNDSTKKIHDNLLMLANNISEKFVVELDEYGAFEQHYVSPIDNTERFLSAISFVPIGLNELVTFDVLYRAFNNIATDTNKLVQMIEAHYEHAALSAVCWTWKYHTIDDVQVPNNNIRPYSWLELRTSNIFQPLSSNITWQLAKSCCGNTNPMEFCWSWANTQCNCILPFKWTQLQCSSILYHKTWDDLINNCCDSPDYYFANCDESC